MKSTQLLCVSMMVAAVSMLMGCVPSDVSSGADELPSFEVESDPHEALPGANDCAPVATLACGSQVEGDTSDPNSGYTDVIDGYPVTIGNYSGPEVAYAFRPLEDGEVHWSLVDPDPTIVNFDLFVLDGSSGSCLATQAVTRGFNDVRFDAVAGRNYFLVLDGYDGDVGAFEARWIAVGVILPRRTLPKTWSTRTWTLPPTASASLVGSVETSKRPRT